MIERRREGKGKGCKERDGKRRRRGCKEKNKKKRRKKDELIIERTGRRNIEIDKIEGKQE